MEKLWKTMEKLWKAMETIMENYGKTIRKTMETNYRKQWKLGQNGLKSMGTLWKMELNMISHDDT